ncbi:ABC transporter substrate-binding protein [Pseudaminobacter soli (ex Li et al. 2025)]|uniref:Solute-binding protein family 3/N-terminal domain-containing protein n=1 Tax=Pseudaminobacter soli (ex Li et al. 2025) TaxID=1295366 RepID=A0A2P7S312_9HYPH|nr:ABC transporter substrate-binding protein [Mesorhizobium soli]PSJ56852.1 hypothetical protein C7I85_23490 [Mesorhizobium soli]
MGIKRKVVASLAVAFAMGAYSGSALAGSETDQVVLGKTITKDNEVAALVPAKFNGTLRIATSAPYPPFEYLDDNGELTGIDIDVTRAIAAKMGVKISFDNVQFDGIIPGLQAGKYDVIASSMGDTAQREKVLNFVDYTTLGNVVLARDSDQSINDLVDLCGKTVTRQSGDVFATFIDKIQPQCQSAGKNEITIKTLPDSNAALLAIKSGSADAQIVNMSAAESLNNAKENSGQFRVVKPADRPHGWSPQNGGFGVLKSETELTAAIEAATKAIKADGTLLAVAEHYGQPSIVIDEVVVNKPTNGEM